LSILLPAQATCEKVPLLVWLSGLTDTDKNVVTKAGVQQYAEKRGLAIVCPDTSPRGAGVPDYPDGNWDFGLGAGFYVNATEAPWSEHYHMYDYVVTELPELINRNFPVNPERASIFGHSMGGHGALLVALRNPERFRSVSAFSPIVSPTTAPWGRKAFTHYLGENESTWEQYDSCLLLKTARYHLPILVDQGSADEFLDVQLKTESLARAAEESGYPVEIRFQEGYDHSYFFIASFIEEHLDFHSRHLFS